MQIHGIRLYPKTVRPTKGVNATIYVHGRLSKESSDFYYIFRNLPQLWKSRIVATDFGVCMGVDPLPGLKERFGAALKDADVRTQLMLLEGDKFDEWAPKFADAGLFVLYERAPQFHHVKELVWSRSFHLSEGNWPKGMTSLVHLWDDIYWQFFTTNPADIDVLIQAHREDPRLHMYFVDIDAEYPDPSNKPLTPVLQTPGSTE